MPFVKAYEKAFPNVKIDLVTYDGDANGDGTMQTKTALFNRVGHGWPDVIFSEQNIDIASLGDSQLHYAGALNGLVPQSIINGYAKGALADCYVGTQLLCLRNDLAFDVLWYNTSSWPSSATACLRLGSNGRHSARRWPSSTPAISSAPWATPMTTPSTCRRPSARSAS